MATSRVQIDEGSTTNLATNTFTEDAVTKHVNRSVLNNSSGTEIGTSSNPVQVTLANTGANTNKLLVTPDLPTGASTSAKQDTGNTSLASIDGKITAVDTGAVVISSGSVTADTELTTADLDTGAGTDTRAVVGLVGAKSGGGVLIPGDATKGLAVDLTATGSNTNALKVDGSAVAQPVTDNSGSLTVDNGGTFATQESGSLLTSAQLIDDIILASDAAAGSAKMGLIGGQYQASPVKISADGDAVNLAVTQHGKILTQTETVAADTTNINNNYASAQTNTSIQSAPGANKRIVVTQIIYSKDTAGTMKLVEDPAGTPATKFGPHYFPANGGMVAIKTYIPLTTNKALGVTTTGGGNETITCVTIIENV